MKEYIEAKPSLNVYPPSPKPFDDIHYQMGMDVDEILTSLSHLTPAQVHAALAYYFDHKKEIDRDLDASSDIEYWKQQVLSRSPKKAPK